MESKADFRLQICRHSACPPSLRLRGALCCAVGRKDMPKAEIETYAQIVIQN
jgi:hypothetical protein